MKQDRKRKPRKFSKKQMLSNSYYASRMLLFEKTLSKDRFQNFRARPLLSNSFKTLRFRRYHPRQKLAQ